ncbi:hypothetical protein [Kingella sp. (in: b-proteobacteria)]|nr:hypothetical protein [Kingella sp. (in: b-proteobacteria)]MDO4656933.1 hypothetical protein [Kingella sp. (in: b-proteobacteria)]
MLPIFKPHNLCQTSNQWSIGGSPTPWQPCQQSLIEHAYFRLP